MLFSPTREKRELRIFWQVCCKDEFGCRASAAVMCPPEYLLCISRSACARAEPVVSACVLVKSLKMHSYMADRPLAAAVFGFGIYVEEVGVCRLFCEAKL